MVRRNLSLFLSNTPILQERRTASQSRPFAVPGKVLLDKEK
jgi:hypothetical protein